jgi:hypothetical protein
MMTQRGYHTAAPRDRRARGKALREGVPRGSHAGLEAPPKRRDPLDLLLESTEGGLFDLIHIPPERTMQFGPTLLCTPKAGKQWVA